MIRSECRIVIEASPEAVFARISDPTKAPEDIPGVTPVKKLCGKWSNTWYQAVSSVADVPIEMNCEFQEYVLGQRLTVQRTGGLDSRVTWRLEAQDGRTCVSLISECRLPPALAPHVPESVLQKRIDRQWQTALANVKARVEAGQRTPWVKDSGAGQTRGHRMVPRGENQPLPEQACLFGGASFLLLGISAKKSGFLARASRFLDLGYDASAAKDRHRPG